MKKLVVFSIAGLFGYAQAQTGPGGAGSSANNVLWLAADKGVTLNGPNVIGWADQSGNNNNATPHNVNAQPVFTANGVNGYPVFTFDGSDDELRISDHNSLDLIQWDIFIVVKPNVQKNYNAWLVKGDDSFENYELLSYNDGNIHSPVKFTDGARDGVNTLAGTVTTAGYEIIEYQYIASAGRDIYKNNTLIGTDNQFRTPATNNHPIHIGNERGTSRFANAGIAEVIIYNTPLNASQKLIVNNYLSAKYGKALGTGDLYTMDNPANGDFDHDVAGIGRMSATDSQLDSRGSGLVRILNASDLNDAEFYLWGHNNLTPQANELNDVPAGVEARYSRIWRGNEINTSGAPVNVGTVDIEFDLTGRGSVTTGDLRLLIDLNNNGVFSDDVPVSGAVDMGGNRYQFQGVSSLSNDLRFTLGTINKGSTPLPVELVSFETVKSGREVVNHWEISYEEDVKNYRIERTTNFKAWETIGTVPAQGLTDYELIDSKPLEGVSYYRLSSLDNDGTIQELGIRAVEFKNELEVLSVLPNPAEGAFVVVLEKEDFENFAIVNELGQTVIPEMQWIADNRLLISTESLSKGVYYLSTPLAAAKVIVL